MRHNTWIGAASLAAVLALVAACTSNPAASATSQGEAPSAASSGTSSPQEAAPVADRADGDKVFYWVSHASSSDPFWVKAAKGASQAAKDLGVKVNESFANADVASAKEAIQAAIAAKAAGIAVSSPKTGSLVPDIKAAMAAGIPVVMFNSDDPTAPAHPYVGGDLTQVGHDWAQYLVDHKLVKTGDNVWLPVETPGASYQTAEEAGIKSVFDPLHISYELFNASDDPAQSLSNMTTYLSTNHAKINAVIGLGDLVMSNIEPAFKTAGITPGSIPVIGWGNTAKTASAVESGYVTAATWQYPESQGYLPIVLLNLESEGLPVGYNIPTTAQYTKADAAKYAKLASN